MFESLYTQKTSVDKTTLCQAKVVLLSSGFIVELLIVFSCDYAVNHQQSGINQYFALLNSDDHSINFRGILKVVVFH